jgi:xanthine dehydrogenase accessory factor
VDERLFARLASRLDEGAVVLASVRATRGATPRKRGSRMLVTDAQTEFSIGGGAAEARVIEAARALLHAGERASVLDIDLSGRPGAAGVCGGRMRIVLRRWEGAIDRARAAGIAATLAAGRHARLHAADDLGDTDGEDETLRPDPRLLVVGAGHCGLALCELARALDFDVWVFDQREACFGHEDYAGATCRWGDPSALETAFDDGREVLAVLLNRDFASDVETLRVLHDRPLAFLGMMGSARRIAQVLEALGPLRAAIEPQLQAPIGLDIGAHTPHEIAISILAQLIRVRAGTPA